MPRSSPAPLALPTLPTLLTQLVLLVPLGLLRQLARLVLLMPVSRTLLGQRARPAPYVPPARCAPLLLLARRALMAPRAQLALLPQVLRLGAARTVSADAGADVAAFAASAIGRLVPRPLPAPQALLALRAQHHLEQLAQPAPLARRILRALRALQASLAAGAAASAGAARAFLSLSAPRTQLAQLELLARAMHAAACGTPRVARRAGRPMLPTCSTRQASHRAVSSTLRFRLYNAPGHAACYSSALRFWLYGALGYAA